MTDDRTTDGDAELAALLERPGPGPHRTTIEVDGVPVETLADLPPLRDRLLFVGLNPSPVSVRAGEVTHEDRFDRMRAKAVLGDEVAAPHAVGRRLVVADPDSRHRYLRRRHCRPAVGEVTVHSGREPTSATAEDGYRRHHRHHRHHRTEPPHPTTLDSSSSAAYECGTADATRPTEDGNGRQEKLVPLRRGQPYL